MFVRHLRLQDFRSWKSFDLSLEPGVTVFLGANGQGKTNILEAVQYLSTLSSHRVSSDQPLIRSGAASAFVAATAINEGRELTVDITLNSGRANRARIRQAPVRRTREALGVVRSVMFAPEDLSLVRGDPGDRRRYLDELMTVRHPRLAGVRADYEKVLRQRSALLKSAGPSMRRGERSSEGASALATLEVWDRQLAAHGSELIAARMELTAELAPHISAAYASIAPESQPARIGYRSSLGDDLPEELRDMGVLTPLTASAADGSETGESHAGHSAAGRRAESDRVDVHRLEKAMHTALANVRDREVARGVCLVGPHRDDLELWLGEHPVKGYASHGESWSYALALRLAALALLRDDGTDPILMLDDVFAELDRRRRSALAAVAANTEQVLVTAAVAEDVPAELYGRRHSVVMTKTEQSGRVSHLADDAGSDGDAGSSGIVSHDGAPRGNDNAVGDAADGDAVLDGSIVRVDSEEAHGDS